MVTERTPKVSIGLAVYNGENYLCEAVNSILSQTFSDFELILSDNASTDRTEEICKAYVRQDPRVRYVRNATNIGGANNENQTIRMARGEYFHLAAHDDICAPEFLAKLVDILDHDAMAVMAYPRIMKIDQYGGELGLMETNKGAFDTPSKRFSDMTSFENGCEMIYGLIRLDELMKTDLQMNYTDSDRSLLCDLCLRGKFAKTNEVLFYKRYHPLMSMKVFEDWRERMAWFGSTYQSKITLPHWMQFLHLLRIIFRAPISLSEKLRCYAFMVVWLFQYHRWGSLIKDILLAGLNLSRRLFGPRSEKLSTCAVKNQ